MILRTIFSCALLVFTCAVGYAQTWFRTLGQPGRAEKALTAYRAPNGMLFVGGSVNDSALVQRVDDDGNVLWARKFKPPGQYPKHVFELVMTPDGTIAGVGNGLGPGPAVMHEGFHFRLDVDGALLWVRSWSDPKVYVKRIVPLGTDEYLLFGCHYDMNTPTTSDVITARVSASDGELLWVSPRMDLYNTVPYVDDIEGVASIGNGHFMTGRVFTNGSPVSTCRVAVTKYTGTGDHQWTKYLLYDNLISRRMYPSDIIAYDDSLTIAWFGDIAGASTNYQVGLIRLDTLGNVAWAKGFNIQGSGQEQSAKVIATASGYVLSGRMTTPGNQRNFIMGVSFDGELQWARTHGAAALIQGLENPYAMNMTNMPGGLLYTGFVQTSPGEFDIMMVRTDGSGEVVCGSSQALTVVSSELPTASFVSPALAVQYSASLSSVPTVPAETELFDQCSVDLSLGGDTAICAGFLLDATIPGAQYEWQDGSTGSSFEVLEAGTYWVRVTLDCCSRADTVVVEWNGAFVIDLGPDTVLCSGEALLLELDSAYEEVVWQDGSVGSSFLVSEPGVYEVDFVDGECSGTGSIVVDFVASPTVDIGPDLTVCEGYPVILGTGLIGLPHTWQDGSTEETYTPAASGTYWVQVGSVGCSAADSVEVFVVAVPEVELGADTILCSGSSLVLDIGLASSSIQWQDGSTDAQFVVSSTGLYWVTLEDQGCTASDTISVTFIDPPFVELGPDLTFCAGDAVTLGTGLVGLSHTWQDGSTEETYTPTASGTYWVQVGAAGCLGGDSVQVEVIPLPLVSLGPDTIVCDGVDLLLVSGHPAWASTWQDGTMASTYQATNPGIYSVDVVVDGCASQASITIGSAYTPTLTLPGDTVLCTADPFIVQASTGGNDPIVWQDGSQGSFLLAMESGTYWATTSNVCGSVTDTVRITFASVVQVPEDVLVCPGENAGIEWSGVFSSIQWSTGSSSVDLALPEGEYTYTAVDLLGCARAGSLLVFSDPSADGVSYVPNVFTPQGDGVNDRFLVVGADSDGFLLEVYDRWGELLHSSTDPLMGWDGRYNGRDVPDGTYVYVLSHRASCGRLGTTTKVGHVTVLR